MPSFPLLVRQVSTIPQMHHVFMIDGFAVLAADVSRALDACLFFMMVGQAARAACAACSGFVTLRQ